MEGSCHFRLFWNQWVKCNLIMKYCEVLAFQQESMSENQISFLDIKIGKVGLDQSQN